MQPLAKCNSAETIRELRNIEIDEAGFHHYRPLKNEQYRYTVPNKKDGISLLFL